MATLIAGLVTVVIGVAVTAATFAVADRLRKSPSFAAKVVGFGFFLAGLGLVAELVSFVVR